MKKLASEKGHRPTTKFFDASIAQLRHSKPNSLVAEWIHFTHFGRILPTIKLKVCTFWGL